MKDMFHRSPAQRGKPRGRSAATVPDRLSDLQAFGSNPGALRARYYVPADLPDGSALVVVLHGCTQTAAGYDHGSGWSRLADEHGFAVLFPEQQRANNANLCFNWFTSDDTRRGSGEAMSIREMVAATVAAHAIDPSRIFVTGLSAGGAMASTMLAAYPDVFAGGAIIAGLPFGTARSVPEAFERMRAQGGPDAAALGRLVTDASDHAGPWPTVSVWHGGSDLTVSPDNAALVVEQWRGVHGVAAEPTTTDKTAGHVRRVWVDQQGREVIEEYLIPGLGHGTPLSTAGEEGCGAAGPFMLEAGISSTRLIARFWKLADAGQTQAKSADTRPIRRAVPIPTAARPEAAALPEATARSARGAEQAEQAREPQGVQRVIEDALRAAGLMR